MPLPLVPIALVALAGGAYYKVRNRGKMTVERQRIYEAALNNLRDPVKLRTLADTFEHEGLLKEATLLRKRAGLRDLPPDIKKARREVYDKALASTDPVTIESVAKAYDGEGATGAAASLRARIAYLKTGV